MSCSRRQFMKSIVGASTVVSLSPNVPGFLQETVAAATRTPAEGNRALVVVQLSGGNDGLNTIVPFDNDVYARSRKTLRLTAGEVHRVDDHQGFHPEMGRSRELFQEGRLSVIHGVGYANSSRDHKEAIRHWYSAHPEDSACATGWIGRAADHMTANADTSVPVAFVSPIPRPLALTSEYTVVPRLTDAKAWLRTDENAVPPATVTPRANGSAPAHRPSLLDFVDATSQAARLTSDQIRRVLRNDDSQSGYPNFPFAQRLRTVSQLVRAELGTRIYFTELGGGGFGGFDSHANQRENHAALLRQLSEGIAAFAADLQHHQALDRVVLMTFSEFGRTVSENGRRGTGHGAAAPVLLVGGRLTGGFHGAIPDLSDLDNDAPKFHTDFRQVYATMLEKWLSFDSQPVLGASFKPLDLFA